MHTNTIHELFAYLRVPSAQQAIDFYTRVFGASELFRLTEPSGRVGHAELQMGPSAVLMLSEAFAEFGTTAPPVQGVDGVAIHLHVDDCDAMASAAVAAGATMVMAPADQFYGERSCRIRDPFGHTWLLGHSIEKLEPAEMQRRYTELMQHGGFDNGGNNQS
jgi:PhnB protein